MTNEKDREVARQMAMRILIGPHRMSVGLITEELLRYRAEAVQALVAKLYSVRNEPDKVLSIIMHEHAAILSDYQEAADECLRTKQELGAGGHDQYGFDQEECHGR